MNDLIQLLLALVPVCLFLAALIYLDGYRLVQVRSLLVAIAVGILAGAIAFMTNTWLLSIAANFRSYSYTLGPSIEESLKALFIIFVIKKGRVGFLLDSAIYGFAVGTGFAIFENYYYFNVIEETHLIFWIIRGCGTAIMHGGCTGVFAIISKYFAEKRGARSTVVFIPGLLCGVLLHAAFNAFWLPPLTETAIQIIVLPMFILLVFNRSENGLRNWLELGLNSDMEILQSIREGKLMETKVGRYLHSLKEKFSPEVVVDLLCYLQIHLELSVRAKGILLTREFGFEIENSPEIRARFEELEHLKRNIGKSGQIAMAPLLQTSTRDLWHIYLF